MLARLMIKMQNIMVTNQNLITEENVLGSAGK